MASDIAKEAAELRRELHQIPETGFTEENTQAFVMKYLSDLGLKPVKAAKTGVACFLDFGKDGAIALRSDMDGLPINEETGLAFASRHGGRMHACGHDGHMSMLLSTAKLLATGRLKPHKNVLLVFQPAEETPGGAKPFLSEGHFEKHGVNTCYGIHLHPSVPFGQVVTRPGEFFASSTEIYFDITGVPSHGAMPQEGRDALLAACHLVLALSSLVGKALSPLDDAIIMLGKIEAGDALNIVAGHAHLEGSIRAYSQQNRDKIVSRIEAACRGISEAFGVDCRFEPRYLYPALLNDEEAVEAALAKAPYIGSSPKWLLSEDFSYYCESVPSVFFLLGTNDGNPAHQHPLHSAFFDFNPEVLEKGIELYSDLLR